MDEQNQVENMADENLYGVFGDLLEWATETEVSVIIVLILLVERMVREWIAMRVKRRDHGHD